MDSTLLCWSVMMKCHCDTVRLKRGQHFVILVSDNVNVSLLTFYVAVSVDVIFICWLVTMRCVIVKLLGFKCGQQFVISVGDGEVCHC